MSDGNQGSFGSHRFDRWIVQLREDLRQRSVSSAKLYFDDHFNGAKLALTCTMPRGLVELQLHKSARGGWFRVLAESEDSPQFGAVLTRMGERASTCDSRDGLPAC